jgi:RNA-directed DNA polymerase
MKNEQEKSDPSIVAKRPANKPDIAEVDLWGSGAESAEPREGTKGNTGEQHTCRTPSRESVSQGLERVREAAKQRKKERFTALLHHVTVDLYSLVLTFGITVTYSVRLRELGEGSMAFRTIPSRDAQS